MAVFKGKMWSPAWVHWVPKLLVFWPKDTIQVSPSAVSNVMSCLWSSCGPSDLFILFVLLPHVSKFLFSRSSLKLPSTGNNDAAFPTCSWVPNLPTLDTMADCTRVFRRGGWYHSSLAPCLRIFHSLSWPTQSKTLCSQWKRSKWWTPWKAK